MGMRVSWLLNGTGKAFSAKTMFAEEPEGSEGVTPVGRKHSRLNEPRV